MFIQFNSFIPAHLGKSLFAWISQELEKYPVDNRNQILGEAISEGNRVAPRTWIKEPVNDLSYCTTDGCDFAEHNMFLNGNDIESSRLYFYSSEANIIKRNGIDLDYIGNFKKLFKSFPFRVKFGRTYKAGVRLKANYGHSVQNTREGLLIANPKVACHY